MIAGQLGQLSGHGCVEGSLLMAAHGAQQRE